MENNMTNPIAEDNNSGQQPEGRMFSQDDVNRIVTKRLAEERAKHKGEDVDPDVDEKDLQHQLEREAFMQEKKAFERERQEHEAVKMLATEKLPVGLAKILARDTPEETAEYIGLLKGYVAEAVQAGVVDRMRGEPPRTGGSADRNAEVRKAMGLTK